MLCLTAPQPACFALLCFPPGRRHGLRLTMLSFKRLLLPAPIRPLPWNQMQTDSFLLCSPPLRGLISLKSKSRGEVPLSSLVTALLRRSLVPQLRPVTSSLTTQVCSAVLPSFVLYCAVLPYIVLYCALLCFPAPMPLQSMSTLPFFHNCPPPLLSFNCTALYYCAC